MKYVSYAREFTNYMPNCEINKNIQREHNVPSGHEYRYFLQRNAEMIMKHNLHCKDQVTNKMECEFCPMCKDALNYKPPTVAPNTAWNITPAPQ